MWSGRWVGEGCETGEGGLEVTVACAGARGMLWPAVSCCGCCCAFISASSAASSSSSSSARPSSGFGFVSLGSLPSFMARRMRAAFHLANLIFFCVSGSGGAQTEVSWKKVAAASKVSAVCL